MNERMTENRVLRMDSVPIPAGGYTSEGYLMDRPIVTSTGVFCYPRSDGTVRRELRLPEEVFSPESLESYRGKPIVLTHDAGLISRDNVSENAIGVILSAGIPSGEDLRAEIVIHDTKELENSPLRELSLGYELDLEETPGVYHGERYDAIQRNIRINHLALVREARAGEQARLNLDGDGTPMGRKLPTEAEEEPGEPEMGPEETENASPEPEEAPAERPEAPADEPETPPGETPEEHPAAEEGPELLPEDPWELLEALRRRRDRREDTPPETLAQATAQMLSQSADLDALLALADSLLAEKAALEERLERPVRKDAAYQAWQMLQGGAEIPADDSAAARRTAMIERMQKR